MEVLRDVLALKGKDVWPPRNFSYPASYDKYSELAKTDFLPWISYHDKEDEQRDHYFGLRRRYWPLDVVPFAYRRDNDDVACFDRKTGDVIRIHDWASGGWERRNRYSDLRDWLRVAFEDFITAGYYLESQFDVSNYLDAPPEEFEYPEEFLRFVNAGIINFPPWRILTKHQSEFPTVAKGLLPLAVKDDGRIACLANGQDRLVIVDSSGEVVGRHATVMQWLIEAIDEYLK